MAKWKNGKGPALWPIDMTQISRVDFIATPQTDVDLALTEIGIGELDSGIPECSIQLKTDTEIGKLIDVLCKRLGRRTPESPERTKGKLNTDVLRLILEKILSAVSRPASQNTGETTETAEKRGDDVANEYGITYDVLKRSCIDIEYETIFGDTKVTIQYYDERLKTIIADVKCKRCLITRDDDGSIANLCENELYDIEYQTGPFSCSVESTMIYSLSIISDGIVVKTEEFTTLRPLEFVFESEYPILLEDGPGQKILPAQQLSSPIYFDDAKVVEENGSAILLVNGHTISLGSVNFCKSRLAKLMFNRAKSKYNKSIMIMEVYDKIDTSEIPWDGKGSSRTRTKSDRYVECWFDKHSWEKEDREETRANVVAKRFESTLNAAIKSFNQDMSNAFGVTNMKVLQLKKHEIFITPQYISPQLKQGRKNKK